MRQLLQLKEFGVAYEGGGDNSALALEAVDLEIRAGEKLALVGESGSGKTTLALALASLLPSHARRFGTMAWEASEPRPGGDIGFVFQDPGGSLNPVRPVGDTIAEVVRIHRHQDRRTAMRMTLTLLDQVRLPDPERIARAYPHQLSGGQRQRVALAAALAGDPQILVADEPTSALDTVVQAAVIELIQSLTTAAGMTLIFISHDIALVSEFADRIAVFRSGRLVEVGTPDEIIFAPGQAYTRHLIEAHRAVGF
ncbi:MAG TPA: ABC transporter ATP-binding protein [Tianweitania sediminis]|jgi:peptide/nickel transport system ATP-binding protein|nr:ABC transporter ATP-binding protein [Tianweitania sediminis]